jgi:serine protease Do
MEQGWKGNKRVKGDEVVKKVTVLAGVFFLCSGLILAGENDSENPEKEIRKEYRIVLNQEEGGGYLGVFLRDIQPEDVTKLGLSSERGVFLAEIAEESPAEKAGLKEGDVITQYQSLPVLSVRQFQRMVADTPPGRHVEIGLYRDGKEMSLNVEIGSNKIAGPVMRKFDMPVPAPGERKWLYRFPEGMAEGLHEYVPGFMGGMLGKGPVLGIEGAAMTDQMADFMGIKESEGVLVTAVMDDSPAEAAGLRAGDLITAVNGKKVADPGDLRDSLKEGTLKLDLVRNKQGITLDVEIAPSKANKTDRETLRM